MIRKMAIWLVCINVFSFCLYGIDKHKAIRHKWRIPEDTLIGCAAAGGGIGAYIGMHVFHHKTQHPKFRVLVPVFTGLWIMFLILVMKMYNG